MYTDPALWITASATKRLELLIDEIYNLGHYRSDRKLLIVNQVDLFGGDDVIKQELQLVLSNISTIEGQILMGC